MVTLCYGSLIALGTQDAAAQLLLQPQYTDNIILHVNGSLKMHFKVAVPFMLLMQANDSLTDVLKKRRWLRFGMEVQLHKEPKRQLPSSSYNHNTLTTFRTKLQ